jgi:hypothetical protein
VGNSPDELNCFIQRELVKWAKAASDAGIRAD